MDNIEGNILAGMVGVVVALVILFSLPMPV